VATAVAIDRQANRVRRGEAPSGSTPTPRERDRLHVDNGAVEDLTATAGEAVTRAVTQVGTRVTVTVSGVTDATL